MSESESVKIAKRMRPDGVVHKTGMSLNPK